MMSFIPQYTFNKSIKEPTISFSVRTSTRSALGIVQKQEELEHVISSKVSAVTSSIRSLSIQSYLSHDPISVSNDTELDAIAVDGNGTEVNPYLLEGWNITTQGSYGIDIQNTTKYFIIRDCWVTVEDVNGISGIYIRNITDNTALISNNICNNNNWGGIFLSMARNSTVVNNTCSRNNGVGIYLESAGNSTVVGNTCSGNMIRGISIRYSESVVIVNNTCTSNSDEGLSLEYSGNSTAENNTCTQNYHGIRLRFSANCTVVNNRCIQNRGFGIFLWWESGFSTVVNNTCFQNAGTGIALDDSEDTKAISNTCRQNGQNGISLSGSTSVAVVNNTCDRNDEDGIVFWNSASAIIVNNTCIQNNGSGLYLEKSRDSTDKWGYYYALNTLDDSHGDDVGYNVTQVRAWADNAQTDYENMDDENFYVSLPSDGSHPSFSFTMVANASWFNQSGWGGVSNISNIAFTHSLTPGTGSPSMAERYNFTRYETYYTEWQPDGTAPLTILENDLIQDAANIIWGGNSGWEDGQGTGHDEWHFDGEDAEAGTHQDNHGFDYLVGLCGNISSNTIMGRTNSPSGVDIKPGNALVVMRGFTVLGDEYSFLQENISNVFLHEIGHIFGCDAISSSDYLMKHVDAFAFSWNLHTNTTTTLDSNYDWFDTSWS